MALPPLAAVSDLADWVGETITDDDKRAAAVVNAASALVRAYTGQDWLSPTDSSQLGEVPDAVHTVTLSVAGRAWTRGGDIESTSETAGPFSETKRYVGDGSSLYLTKTDKLMLNEHRAVGRHGGIGTLSTTRGEDERTEFYPVEGSAYPFPLYASDEGLL